MSARLPPFVYAPSLQEYMVSAKEFFTRHPQYHMLVSGAVIFNREGKMLLVQRAKEEKAFPNFWEIPGGKVDDTDETILHAVVREVKEETGLQVTRIVRKVAEFGWDEPSQAWWKLIFEVQVESLDNVVLDPIEHQAYVFATEQEIVEEQVAGGPALSWVSPPNKDVKLAAFRLRREAGEGPDTSMKAKEVV
ncbi:uncharacterized protein EI97DRAFT_419900 [Westerdykella ornata]|uniref:Nudix hydrolase domain-containing protein n=1 Tax=Westerdykella ornata TaxID=318751 RepID=A0A6A6JHA2_WESOR|nr:uncharacterized protein EI97DRAFT_419900 [Westerdykella ornata]KAF2275595.1 hypothetical protein EI97DRAFT_419900 [Westerdykella ornata]